MIFTKAKFLELLKEGKNISEIIDNDLSLISGAENSDSEEVTNKTTTDSFVAAATQQVGKNRYVGTFMEDVNLDEANSELQGKTYTMPEEIVNFLRTKLNSGEGAERINAIIQNPAQSYEQVKRFKHDIENKYQGDWRVVLGWINQVLATDRDSISRNKQVTMDTGMQNRYLQNHEKNGLQPTPITESTNFNVYKATALRDMVKTKREEILKLRSEIKEIETILKSKIKNNIDETKK